MTRRSFFKHFGGLVAATAVAQGIVGKAMKLLKPEAEFTHQFTVNYSDLTEYLGDFIAVNYRFPEPLTIKVRKGTTYIRL